ncbi:MAG TPA: putative baseplate assembly protein [Blastocatellia bacterium]|nr:putative baseplate assembly protein [Blastocatellia bacterium]
MSTPAPKIDLRTAVEISQQARDLLKVFAPEWKESGASGGGEDLASALIEIFARYSEIIINRLNQTPNKNFLAFLDLLGASLMPPQPARAPLTFSLSEGSAVDGVVPAGTQVAATPAEGESDPVIFETERELVVTAARLDSIFVREPERDLYANLSALASEGDSTVMPLFEGDTPIDHILYVGDLDVFGLPKLTNAQLTLDFDRILQDEMTIAWERLDGTEWSEMVRSKTAADSQQHVVAFGAIAPIPPGQVEGIETESRWVRGRLITPITLSETQSPGEARANQLPLLNSLAITGSIGGEVTPENSFANQAPLDTSKDFLPFGPQPAVGDAWLISQSEAFSQAGVRVALNIEVTAGVKASDDLDLKWEFWNGAGWVELKPVDVEPNPGQVQDSTAKLTKSGSVALRLPAPAATKEINGVEGSWLRARVARGNYGSDIEYKEVDFGNNNKGFVISALPTFAPPLIGSLKISYAGDKSEPPDVVMAYNNFAFSEPVPGELPKPFRAVNEPEAGGETRPAFYLGFTPPGRGFSQRAVSVYLSLVEPLFGAAPVTSTTAKPVSLAWEYWNGKGWGKLIVNDGAAALTRPGIIEFLPPSDFSLRREFGQSRYWARVRWDDGQFDVKPQAGRVLLNTTMASQSATVREEILGSSDGNKNQTFKTTLAPILSGQRLEVREGELPSAAEQRDIRAEEGEDAINITDEEGQPSDVWVRWHETPDFYGSGPRDRHYRLDHLTGEVRFGDGASGMIPPPGAGNLRMALYRTGGGLAGNKPAGAIIQLKTTAPYVDKVTNHLPATGGADAETYESLLERAPRTIRHNYRAVTVEDFEDVAMLASPEMARAKCVPLRNLGEDPLDRLVQIDPLSDLPGLRGHVSVIIVPRSVAPKPLPSLELIERVEDYLGAYCLATARVSVVGPIYIRVDVTTEISLVSLEGAGAVEGDVRQSLADFLHPLSGGLDGKGWDFGREPHLSDLYALIESVPGVDHVNSLTLGENVDDDDVAALGLTPDTAVSEIKKTGRFLVYSGAHAVSLQFEDQ